MIKFISTKMSFISKEGLDPGQDYLEFLGELSELMKIMGIKNRALSYRIKPDDIIQKVNIITLDLQEHVN